MICENSGQHVESLTKQEEYIMEMVDKLIRNIQHVQTQQQLSQHYNNANNAPIEYLNTFFNLILKLRRNFYRNSITFQQFQYYVQSLLVYLKHLVQKERYRMPKITKEIRTLYSELSEFPNLRQLTILLLKTFFSKIIHRAYVNDFLDETAYNLMHSLQTHTLTIPDVRFLIQIIEKLTQERNRGRAFSAQSQNLFKMLISQYGNFIPMSIPRQTWLYLILTFASFMKIKVPREVIEKNILERNYSIKVQLKLTEALNSTYSVFTNLQFCYRAMQEQLKRLNNRTTIQIMYEQLGIEPIQEFCKSILNILKVTLPQLQNPANFNLGQQFLLHYFKELSLFEKCVLTFLQIIQEYPYQSSQISFVLTHIMEQFSDVLSQQQLAQYICQVKNKISPTNLFCLLSGMPRNIMERFAVTQLVLFSIEQITSNKVDVEENMLHIQIFLQFLIHYVNTYHYFETDQIKLAIEKLAYSYIGGNMARYENLKQNRILKIKSYCVSIALRLQKYNYVANHERIAKELEICHYLMGQIINNLSQNREDYLEIIVDALRQMVYLERHRVVLEQELMNYFLFYLQKGKKTVDQQHIAHLLLKPYHQYFNYLQIKNCIQIKEEIFFIIKGFLCENNKSLQSQVCQIVLRILFLLNSKWIKSMVTEVYVKQVFKKLVNTGLFIFIENAFYQLDQDFLYCKILMEALLIDFQLVFNLLNQVCTKFSNQTIHYFDPVWEALIVLHNVRTDYTQTRGINAKLEKIMGGSIEDLFLNMTLDEKQDYNSKSKKQSKKQRIYWSWLPEVRKVIQPGSVVGSIVQNKLNERSNI